MEILTSDKGGDLLDESVNLTLRIIGLGILIALSAFFSGSETALFSLSRLKTKQLQRRVNRLLEKPRSLLINLLVGNTLVNLGASGLSASISLSIFRIYGIDQRMAIVLSIFVMTGIILVFGEILPKIFGVNKPKEISEIVARPIELYSLFVFPIQKIFILITNFTTSFLEKGKVSKEERVGKEEIESMISVGEDEGVLKKQERKMMESIFEFGKTTVREVMVGKDKIIGIPINSSFSDVVDLIRNSGHSRIPMYDGGDIIGIIHIKDLIPYLNKEKVPIVSFIQPVYFVKDTYRVNQVLRDFQKRHVQLAIVKDEKGEITGLVTMEDLLEEIFGEIEDEYDIRR